jgi:hypothetical protein
MSTKKKVARQKKEKPQVLVIDLRVILDLTVEWHERLKDTELWHETFWVLRELLELVNGDVSGLRSCLGITRLTVARYGSITSQQLCENVAGTVVFLKRAMTEDTGKPVQGPDPSPASPG